MNASARTAHITDIFSSLQGEGLCMGERHLFVRFQGCNLHCYGCDETKKETVEYTVHELVARLKQLEAHEGPHARLSLTGGEPLLHAAFIKELAHEISLPILLETNGTQPDALKRVRPLCALISMDIKLRSVWKTIPDCYVAHRSFLMAAKKQPLYIKIAISQKACEKEFMRYIRMIHSVRSVPVVLQPHTCGGAPASARLIRKICAFQVQALSYMEEVRVLPRLHVLWNMP